MYDRDKNPNVVWMNAAGLVSQLSSCTRRKVGAVVVEGANVAAGYNETEFQPGCGSGGCPRGTRTYAQQPPGGSYADCSSIHAEVNAIEKFVKQYKVTSKTKLFTTREPCTFCWAAITSAGIKRHNVYWSK